MNRRTFVKMAASSTMLGAAPPIEASKDQGKFKPWPEIAYFDNPIANGRFPLKFVEELPLVIRGYEHTSRFVKETEIFRFMAHEWLTDAVLFRGLEIKPRDPSNLSNGKLLGKKFNLYVDDYGIFDGLSISAFMKEGGAAFPYWDPNPTRVRYSAYRGWATKDGWPEGFLGYFLPNKTCISAKLENCEIGSVEVEIALDMARYSSKKQSHQRVE